jgi:hypothetical protein
MMVDDDDDVVNSDLILNKFVTYEVIEC